MLACGTRWALPIHCLAMVAAVIGTGGPMAAQDKIVESTYFPIKVGSSATFRFNNRFEHEFRCTRIEVVHGKECGRFETYTSSGRLISVEYYHVASDGVYVVAFNANRFNPPMLVFPLPAKAGKSFRVETSYIGSKVGGDFTLGSEKLTSPAGVFAAIFAKSMNLTTFAPDGKPATLQSTCKWFAPKVGLVRQSLGVGSHLLADGILVKYRPGVDAPRSERKKADDIVLAEGDYFPLKAGSVSTFLQPWDVKEIRCIKQEKFANRDCWRLESSVDGKVKSFEHVYATADGIYRAGHDGNAVDPPQLLLRLPVKVGDRWKVQSTIKGDKVEGNYAVTAERVTTTHGVHDAAVVRTTDLRVTSKQSSEQFTVACWYVAGLGLVKQEFTRGPQTVSYELSKHQPGR